MKNNVDARQFYIVIHVLFRLERCYCSILLTLVRKQPAIQLVFIVVDIFDKKREPQYRLLAKMQQGSILSFLLTSSVNRKLTNQLFFCHQLFLIFRFSKDLMLSYKYTTTQRCSIYKEAQHELTINNQNYTKQMFENPSIISFCTERKCAPSFPVLLSTA